MVKLTGIALAMLFALIVIALPMSGVRAQETFLWGANVPSSGEPISSPVLEAGRQYRIEAREMFWYNKLPEYYYAADAQYYTTDGSDPWMWGNHFPAPDGASFLQINEMNVSWGPFSNGDTGHTYSIYYFGQGAAITFRIVDWIDKDYSNNDCHLVVRIYRLPAPRTIGFWKTHPNEWPVNSITIGGVTYNRQGALGILWRANAKDATYMLAAQLIAAKLNLLNGAHVSTDMLQTIDDADGFLSGHPLGSNPQGEYRAYALTLKDALDNFNNGL